MKTDAIFIHALWRSGSTYLFSVFRRSPSRFYCYLEPVHETVLRARRNPDELLFEIPDINPLRHPHLDKTYFFELFEAKSAWLNVITKPIIYDGYFGTTAQVELQQYLLALINHPNQRVVIQECRTCNRVSLIRSLVGGVHIYLWRNPWDQWWSFKISDYFNAACQLIAGGANVPVVIQRVCLEIGLKKFSHEDIFEEIAHFQQHKLSPEHSYLLFYVLWCLALIENFKAADFIISIDSISESQRYRDTVTNALSSLGILELEFSDCDVPRTAYTNSEIIFFSNIEERAHKLLVDSGHAQDIIQAITELRSAHLPAIQRIPIESDESKRLLRDASRAREIVLRYERGRSSSM